MQKSQFNARNAGKCSTSINLNFKHPNEGRFNQTAWKKMWGINPSFVLLVLNAIFRKHCLSACFWCLAFTIIPAYKMCRSQKCQTMTSPEFEMFFFDSWPLGYLWAAFQLPLNLIAGVAGCLMKVYKRILATAVIHSQVWMWMSKYYTRNVWCQVMWRSLAWCIMGDFGISTVNAGKEGLKVTGPHLEAWTRRLCINWVFRLVLSTFCWT